MNPKAKTSLTFLLTTVLFSGYALQSPGTAEAQESEEAKLSTRSKTKKSRKTAMRELMKIFKSEPSIKDAQKWALRHYKLSPSRVNSMATNARLKGLIPGISLSFTNNQGKTFGNLRDGLYPVLPGAAGSPNPDNLKERRAGTSSNNSFHVGATWNLDRLVFNAESLDVKSLNSLGETMVREVSTLYYSRRRLLAGIILSPSEDPEELFFELIRLDEMTSTLDALTGNRFSKTTWKWDESMIGL